MKQEFLNDLHTHCAQMRHASAELERLSNAFYVTGNAMIADQLGAIAGDLSQMQQALRDSYGRELGQQLEQSQAAFRETVSAAFRGLTRQHQ